VICPYTKQIIWINGGVPSGVLHDLKLAEIGFFQILQPHEYVLADKAYIGNTHAITPIKGKHLQSREIQYNMNLGMAHVPVENVFAHFKRFSCLKQQWRHSRVFHPIVFGVIAEIVNIEHYMQHMY